MRGYFPKRCVYFYQYFQIYHLMTSMKVAVGKSLITNEKKSLASQSISNWTAIA